MWNQIEIKLIFILYIYFIKHFAEQRLNKMLLFQNLKINQHEKITQTVWWHVATHWFIRHHWDWRAFALSLKNDCNGRWKKWCRQNKYIINSTSIEIVNPAKRLKKRKNYVKYSSIHRMKKIEKFIFMWMITNRCSYTKWKFWNFAKQLIRISRKKNLWRLIK